MAKKNDPIDMVLEILKIVIIIAIGYVLIKALIG